jgi:hypothetical protein
MGGRSDFEQLGFLVLEHLVDLVGVLLGEPVERFSAPVTSSLPTSPSFSSFSRPCLAVRRRLRTATRPSSALVRATLMYSLRRSSVSSGKTQRSTLPSLEGLTPRSESRIARSMAGIAPWSKGWIRMVRASGAVKLASCCSGVWVP